MERVQAGLSVIFFFSQLVPSSCNKEKIINQSIDLDSSGTLDLRTLREIRLDNGAYFIFFGVIRFDDFFFRSYLEGLRLGYLTQDPSKFNDPNVCDPYL